MTAAAFTYDELVNGLVAAGFSRAKAEARAAQEHIQLGAINADVATKRANVLEKAEQAYITRMARAIGFHVYNLSQSRASKQTPGLGDIWLVHQARHFAGWFESKRQVGGVRSAAQVAFGEECAAADIPYGFGDRYAFALWLSQCGFTPPNIPE